MVKERMQTENKEIPRPEEIYILSPVFQPNWYPGEVDFENKGSLSDKIRGDLILKNIEKADELGYSVVIVYSANENPDFIEAMKNMAEIENKESKKNKIIIKGQEIEGYSQARREAIWAARQPMNGCEVMVMLELEKPMIEHIPEMVLPVIKGCADITITDRQIISSGELSNEAESVDENLRGLPRYQARSEKKFSKWLNSFLKEEGMVPSDFQEIDWMGNRAWKNDSILNQMALVRYGVKAEGVDANIRPDHLSAALFFPLVETLYKNVIADRNGGKKIKLVSVPIDYHHPSIQSELENNDLNFIKKRDTQREMLTKEMIEYVKMLKNEGNILSRPGLMRI